MAQIHLQDRIHTPECSDLIPKPVFPLDATLLNALEESLAEKVNSSPLDFLPYEENNQIISSSELIARAAYEELMQISLSPEQRAENCLGAVWYWSNDDAYQAAHTIKQEKKIKRLASYMNLAEAAPLIGATFSFLAQDSEGMQLAAKLISNISGDKISLGISVLAGVAKYNPATAAGILRYWREVEGPQEPITNELNRRVIEIDSNSTPHTTYSLTMLQIFDVALETLSGALKNKQIDQFIKSLADYMNLRDLRLLRPALQNLRQRGANCTVTYRKDLSIDDLSCKLDASRDRIAKIRKEIKTAPRYTERWRELETNQFFSQHLRDALTNQIFERGSMPGPVSTWDDYEDWIDIIRPAILDVLDEQGFDQLQDYAVVSLNRTDIAIKLQAPEGSSRYYMFAKLITTINEDLYQLDVRFNNEAEELTKVKLIAETNNELCPQLSISYDPTFHQVCATHLFCPALGYHCANAPDYFLYDSMTEIMGKLHEFYSINADDPNIFRAMSVAY